MAPDPRTSCGPYTPVISQPLTVRQHSSEEMRMLRPAAAAADEPSDTVGIVALDIHGNIAGGTTTNGATFKIPGFDTVLLTL